jgi:hypothetical protein
MANIGDRVGAVASITQDGICELFGFGEYLGELIPDYEGERGTFTDLLKALNQPNPTIKLDNGEYVYGCECWWGSEQELKERLEQCKEVKVITIKEFVETESEE